MFKKPPSGRKLSKQQEELRAKIAEANAKADTVEPPAPPAESESPADSILSRAIDAIRNPEKVKGRTAKVSVDLIDMNPTPQRRFYPEWTIRRIAHSIKRTEQRDPIHVYANPDAPGRYYTTDGWTRVLAIRNFGEELGLSHEVDVKILADVSPLEAAMYGYFQNKDRHDTADIDDAFFFKDLMDTYGLSRPELQGMTGVNNASEITHLLSFTELDPSIVEAITPHKYTFSRNFAYVVLKIQERHGVDVALQAALDVIGKPVKAEVIDGEAEDNLDKPPKYKGISFDKLRRRLQDLDNQLAGNEGAAKGGGSRSRKASDIQTVISQNCVIKAKGHSVGIEIKTRKLKPEVRQQMLDEVEGVLRRYFAAEA